MATCAFIQSRAMLHRPTIFRALFPTKFRSTTRILLGSQISSTILDSSPAVVQSSAPSRVGHRASYSTSSGKTLSPHQIQIIKDRPIDRGRLERHLASLRKKDSNLQIHDLTDLILTLSQMPAGGALPSHYPGRRAGAALLSVMSELINDDRPELPDQLRLLVDLLLQHAPDQDIWVAALDAIRSFPPPPVPISTIPPTFDGTAIAQNSAWVEENAGKEVVERKLFYEIRDCTFRGVQGFEEKFFNPRDWDEKQREMLRLLLAKHNGKTWENFPSVTDEGPVYEWLCSLEAALGAKYELQTTQTAHEVEGKSGQMDVFFQLPKSSPGRLQYKDVLVVGELKKTYRPRRFKSDLLQLLRHVRSMFSDQPTRRVVHAFSLCGSYIELWCCDRSGIYSSGAFSIHQHPERFARAFVGYSTMGSDLLGLDTFIERDDQSRHITVTDPSNNAIRLRLREPLVRQSAIVCRATACYATDDGYVVKFSWSSHLRQSEAALLGLAKSRGVQGVASLVGYSRITDTDELRSGLTFPRRHKFRESPEESRPSPAKSRSKGVRRGTSDTVMLTKTPLRRDLPNRGNPRAGKDWDNKVFSCLVTGPAGRTVSEFETVKELLETIRDAIKAHESLYIKGKILHRDVSSNNIIITDPNVADGFRGMMIDLDLAKEEGTGTSGATRRTGTARFMAIQVLEGADHTYRHDLESFLYILIWMCARQSWENGLVSSGEARHVDRSLHRWEQGDFLLMASSKRTDMMVGGLERDILPQFPKACAPAKDLCVEIRNILFHSSSDRALNVGTPKGYPDSLYKPIIGAFDVAIGKL